MVWELLYCVMFFVLPIVGMFAAIAIRAFGYGERDCTDEREVCVNGLSGVKVAAGGDVRSYYYSRTPPREYFNEGGVVIDFYAYREWGIIKIIKRRIYARDGPRDTS